MFSAWVSPVAGNQENVSPAAMFHFFPIVAAARFNVDEQAFIFAPKFCVQVARLARRGSAMARNPPRAREIGGSRCRQPTLGRCAQTKSCSIVSN